MLRHFRFFQILVVFIVVFTSFSCAVFADQGYTWNKNSIEWVLATKMLWNPEGFPAKYHDERAQFDLFYRWLKDPGNMRYEVSSNFPSAPNVDSIDELFTMAITNNTSSPMTFSPDYAESTKDSSSYSFTEGLEIGSSAEFSCNLPAIGGAKTELSVKANVSASQETTQEETREWRWNVSGTANPGETIYLKMAISKLNFTGYAELSYRAIPVQGKKFTVAMNYNSWEINPSSKRYLDPGKGWKNLTDDDFKFNRVLYISGVEGTGYSCTAESASTNQITANTVKNVGKNTSKDKTKSKTKGKIKTFLASDLLNPKFSKMHHIIAKKKQ